MPIDVNRLRVDKGYDPDLLRESQRKRHADINIVDNAIEVDNRWRKANFALDKLREGIGVVQKKIAVKKKAAKSAGYDEPCESELQEKNELVSNIESTKSQLENLSSQRTDLVHRIGNIVDDNVPVSNSEDDNVVVRTWGTPPDFRCDGKTRGRYFHHQLMYMLGMFDSKRASAVSGARSYFLQGAGVLLNMALINYGVSFLAARKYIPMQPPYFMKKDVEEKFQF